MKLSVKLSGIQISFTAFLMSNSRHLAKLRYQLGVRQLHATELRDRASVKIVPDILRIHKRYDVQVDLYRVAKEDHSLIYSFD
ncbi:hypothetical protein SAMN05421863_106225 [Nitrosomonas communis]|uniref:Uncharacterized protein n=1 Tax=Nitrosomonas communis TaxID=44574 RepID=A0A1I4UBU8_9PROT|nr:hypothetical protein SAMN05421863_106225 [Nitrosomonas communis]